MRELIYLQPLTTYYNLQPNRHQPLKSANANHYWQLTRVSMRVREQHE